MGFETTRGRPGRRQMLLGAILVAIAPFSLAASADLEQAREMLDTYYGNPVNLAAAQEQLERAIVELPNDARVYVEAARLAVMSGHIVGNQFRGNTVQVYHALLDRALALDPKNAKAHILKAEAFDTQGAYEAEKQSLDRARELGTADPWLWNGYARYYRNVKDEPSARAALGRVIDAGVGTSSSSRKAYVKALQEAAWLQFSFGKTGDALAYAKLARQHRHPADAWVMGSMARLLNFQARYDDAIEYGREAVRTMSHGVARNALSTALYGKAAQLVRDGRQAEADRLVVEASALRSDPDAVWLGFPADHAPTRELSPILREMIYGPPAPLPAPAKERNALPRPHASS